jgi:hypothetical protein
MHQAYWTSTHTYIKLTGHLHIHTSSLLDIYTYFINIHHPYWTSTQTYEHTSTLLDIYTNLINIHQAYWTSTQT